ncbi:MAG: outer membrane beta-barrel protein [Bacteroidia bacterium]
MPDFFRPASLFFFIFLGFHSYSQSYTFSGIVRDQGDKEPIIGVNVVLRLLQDTTQFYGASTALNGSFEIQEVPAGRYRVELSFLGYKTKKFPIRLFTNLRMDTLTLVEDTELLEETVIQADALPVKQNGDTTEYSADAFKTNPDADGSDLVKKMPGITTKDGKIQAQGEDVQKVTIDGQEFFGEDAMLALKNLPAQIIDKVQVYDKLSDQSQFTGYNDGNTVKTINIVTKSGKADGQFGKLYAGYGTNEHYNAGFNANIFNGKQRLTFIGLSNNINLQNFANDDLLGALSVPKGGNRGGGRRYGPQTGTNPSDFLVGEQGGINTAHSFGVNYIDMWGKKLKVNASYFVNGLENKTNQSLQRAYYLSEAGNQNYEETNLSHSNNINHRINLRLEYTLDSNNSIIYTPRISFQGNLSSSNLLGVNRLNSQFLSSTLNESFRDRSGFSYGHDLLFRHKFKKEGRTISLGLNNSMNASRGNSKLYAENRFSDKGTDSVYILDQQTVSEGLNSTMGIRLMYTESLAKIGQLNITYSPTRSRSFDEMDTRSLDSTNGLYQNYDSLLSNNLKSYTDVQQLGAGLRLGKKKLSFFAMLNVQHSQLYAEQKVPSAFVVDKQFNALLPFSFIRYEFSKGNQIRLFYRTSTSLPRASQLQSGIDNSNPLLLTQGNPDLDQSYAHRLGLRINRTNVAKGRTLFVAINGNYQNNYIAGSSTIARNDTSINGVFLARGTQLNKPVNLDGSWNASVFGSYAMPVKRIKCNLNLNLNLSRSQTPGLINEILNYTQATALNLSLVLSSNISEKIDFSFSYAADLNQVRNTFQPQLNNDYLLHAAAASFSWIQKKGFLVTTQASYISYIGLGDIFNSDYLIWNAAVGYKFLKNDAGDIRLSVFDILGQNNTLTRNVNEIYVEDIQNQVLQRYFMLTFTYTFRNFNAAKPSR